MNTQRHSIPFVADFDPSDTRVPCEHRILSASMFDDYMRRVAAAKAPRGGYAKLRGNLRWYDADGSLNEIGVRIDVDHERSEGVTLHDCMRKRAENVRTKERAREALRACGGDPDEWARAYQSASNALAPPQKPRLYVQTREHVSEVRGVLRAVGAAHQVRFSVRAGRGSMSHAVMVSLTRRHYRSETVALRESALMALIDAGYESASVIHSGMSHGMREHALFLTRHYGHAAIDFSVAKIVNN